ncbi:MAG TPA: DUF1579 domain-containing protein [Ferruginibacter sp.]|nr:DUF1579 domain-containing protein [Ferruginibacter sp.]
MKRIILTACSAILLLIACNSSETKESTTDSTGTTPVSTDVKKDEAWVPVDSATMMKAMMDYGTPGDMHKMLASWNGTWSGETTMWESEGAAPRQSSGTAVNSMIFGDRYQTSTHKGNMMGMPFEGRSTMGYDNATKKFVSTWIDTWSTGIMNMSGNWDATTKTLNMSGTMPDICRPGKECTLREVFTVVDDNTQRMEMYGPDPKTGKEYKMMEIKMTRKK